MTAIATPPVDQSTVKGGMQERRQRELADGSLIEFEYAPVGYLTQKGDPRRKEWRAYYWTPADKRVLGKRERLVSVSTILDTICPKGGLPYWYEARGIEGAIEAIRIGELDPKVNTPEDAVQRVRALKLGGDRAKDDAADRGLDAHQVMEVYMVTGAIAPRDQYPPEHWGYLQAVADWIATKRPEPLAVEQLVASPKDGYAGRSDLLALVDGKRIRYDAKSNPDCKVYDSAHVQVQLYERAAIESGEDPADECMVVVFGSDGKWREMPCAADAHRIGVALDYYGFLRPIVSACESANRLERKARS